MDDAAGRGHMTAGTKPRDDILVSICLSDLPSTDAAFAMLLDVARRLIIQREWT